ncbi:MAG TPA: hypothetical protein VNQ53_10415 [Nocardioides sp.]|nr:hypothetical protein [Nocardioides sp.]
MPSFVPHVLIGAGITLAIWLLSDDGWPGLVIGVVLAFALWLMLRLRPVEEGQDPQVPPTSFLATAVVGVAFGYLFYRLGDENAVWWSVGFILAGLVIPVGAAVSRGPSRD